MYNDAARKDANFPVKQMTNVEFVTSIMEFSQYGGLAQMFIVDAIGQVADKLAAMTPEEIEKAFKKEKRGFVVPSAWHGVAKEISRKMREKYG